MRVSEPTGLLAALLLAASMGFYLEHVMIGHQTVEAAERGIPRGNLSDLYPRWLGARELLLRHRDPYSSEITKEIQSGYYGRPLDPSLPNDPKDQQGFAYPLYVVFLLAPTIRLPFSVVQIGFFWLLVAATMATVFVWLRTFEWHASWATILTAVVLTLGSFQVLQGLKLQQLSLLVSALIAGSVALVVSGHLAAAGTLLALATIKPQLVLPLLLWFWLWVASDWPRRKSLAMAFGGVMAALVAGAELVFPGWIAQFRHALSAYREYNDGAWSVLQMLTSPHWGNVLAVLVLAASARLGWKLRGAAAGSPAFYRMTTLVLAATVLVAPKTSPYNHILLLPAVLLVARSRGIVWLRGPVLHVSWIAATLILFWPWLAALLLTLLSWLRLTALVEKFWIAPLYTTLAIPLAVCALLALSLHLVGESSEEVKSAPASAR